MALALIVVLALGGLGVYVAYQNPKLGTALLVGLAVVTTLYLISEKDPSVFETDSPVPSAPVQTPSGTSSGQAPPTPAASASPPGSV
ncbi:MULTISPECIES: hypothetical protein [unclassified Streptomyces]|uniref:hypothetical protein n=1 Tax=unclassified Streptomyces TaxID=2593676 RepID=UPI00344BD918